MSDRDTAERMLTEIALGIPKNKSLVIENAADAALWDRLERDIAKIREAGGDVDYGYTDPF